MIARAVPRAALGPLLTITLAFLLWLAGLFLFAAALPRQAPEDDITTDGIVVLTGGSERLTVGFDLLRAGKARKLLISGVYRGVEVRELLALSSRSGRDLECCVDLGYDADDTEGNAVETARWMAQEGFRSLRVVTANYHMPRSLVEFRRVLPGITLVPHPVTPQKVRLDGWWGWPGTSELIVSEYNKYLLAVARAALTGSNPPDP
ncbi:YdcF family protein [Niveispirillum fermenti]|uniref:YdcF family protein n=1 Tax=Niveispirillum fermenti TaxID=1233113 RepID=UPI003A8BE39D